MQEAFVAALLAIARGSKEKCSPGLEGRMEDLGDGWIGVGDTGDDDLDDFTLWVEIKKQIKVLREGIKGDKQD